MLFQILTYFQRYDFKPISIKCMRIARRCFGIRGMNKKSKNNSTNT